MTDRQWNEPIDLDGIAGRLADSTPGRWYRDVYDDEYATSMVVVTTQEPTSGRHFAPRWPDFPRGAVVAATLVQSGPEFCHASERWDQDAEFIAHARTDVENLLAEVIRLRAIIDTSSGPLP